MNGTPKAPCVGEMCVWFPHGDITQEPFAATVVSRLSDECITLYTLSPTGRREPMLNVKHISHPDHDSAPQGKIRWGAWDLVGKHEERQREIRKITDEKRKKSQEQAIENLVIAKDSDSPDETELKIIQFSRELGDVPGRAKLVAEKMGGNVTHQRVNAILRRYEHLMIGELPLSIAEGE